MPQNIKRRIFNKVETYFLYIRENLRYYFLEDCILVEGYPHSKNFGDALNIFIVSKLSGKNIIYRKFLVDKNAKSLACVGSILQWSGTNSVIWGAGFIKPVAECQNQFTAANIYAVRGYKTLEILKQNNYEISNVKIGDPALLLPVLYKKNFLRGRKIGILPHYVDKNSAWIQKMIDENSNVICIDIEKGQKIDEFLTNLNDCEIILSSSLHGLILADTFAIRNVWIKFNDNIEGGNFKFNDYYSSIGVADQVPVKISQFTEIDSLIRKAKINPIQLDLDALLNSFPSL